jgi:deoxyribonuclease V
MLKEKRSAFHHSWNLPPKKAIELQKYLARKVIRKSYINIRSVNTVAGIDTSYRSDMACAAVVVLNFKNLETVEYKTAVLPVDCPYIPGLLSFREDGQGIAHQRRFGIASHLGLLLDRPAIGCAKTKLVGRFEEPGQQRGDFSYLDDRGEIIGAVVRTRTQVKPVFVSVGHRVNLSESIELVLRTGQGLRLPEPIRLADKLSREMVQRFRG